MNIHFQVLVYKDDFTSERADRERAQSKIQELQAENACLQHQLNRRQVKKKKKKQNILAGGPTETGVKNLKFTNPWCLKYALKPDFRALQLLEDSYPSQNFSSGGVTLSFKGAASTFIYIPPCWSQVSFCAESAQLEIMLSYTLGLVQCNARVGGREEDSYNNYKDKNK